MNKSVFPYRSTIRSDRISKHINEKKSICFLIWEIAVIPTSHNHILLIPLILSPPQDKNGNQDDKADQTDQDYQDYHDDQNDQDYQDD